MENQIALVVTFADQAVIAIKNTRLFEEVQARTRELAKTVEELEIASQHKNQFVANMSHELRTLLAAILGYAELIQEAFFEPLGPKSLDALTRIRSNGKEVRTCGATYDQSTDDLLFPLRSVTFRPAGVATAHGCHTVTFAQTRHPHDCAQH